MRECVCVCHRGTIIGCRVTDVFIRRQKDTWLKMGWIWEGNGQTQIANYILNNHIHQVIHPYSHLTVPLSNQSRNLSPHHSLNPSILLRFAHFPSLTRSSFIRPLLDGGSQRCLLFLWLPGINIDVWTACMDVTVCSERERKRERHCCDPLCTLEFHKRSTLRSIPNIHSPEDLSNRNPQYFRLTEKLMELHHGSIQYLPS